MAALSAAALEAWEARPSFMLPELVAGDFFAPLLADGLGDFNATCLTGFFAVFLAALLAVFLAGFFAVFLAAFFATFLAVFLAALRAALLAPFFAAFLPAFWAFLAFFALVPFAFFEDFFGLLDAPPAFLFVAMNVDGIRIVREMKVFSRARRSMCRSPPAIAARFPTMNIIAGAASSIVFSALALALASESCAPNDARFPELGVGSICKIRMRLISTSSLLAVGASVPSFGRR